MRFILLIGAIVLAGLMAVNFSSIAKKKVAVPQRLTLFQSPDSSSQVVDHVLPNNRLISIIKTSKWLKVGNPRNGKVGWVKRKEYQQALKTYFQPMYQKPVVSKKVVERDSKPVNHIAVYRTAPKAIPAGMDSQGGGANFEGSMLFFIQPIVTPDGRENPVYPYPERPRGKRNYHNKRDGYYSEPGYDRGARGGQYRHPKHPYGVTKQRTGNRYRNQSANGSQYRRQKHPYRPTKEPRGYGYRDQSGYGHRYRWQKYPYDSTKKPGGYRYQNSHRHQYRTQKHSYAGSKRKASYSRQN